MSNMGYLFFKLATDNLVPFNYNAEGPLDQDDLYFNAVTWVRRALFTNDQNPEALFLMGKLHEEGYAVDKNLELAQKYYESAAEQGLPKALTKLAHFYYPSNIQKAASLYQQALKDGGDSEAANCLGLIHEKQEQWEKAKESYEQAIALDGNLDALFNLGILNL